MAGLTAADFADTGQWRLIVNIYTHGISAYLENTIHPDVELQELFTSEWEENTDNLLQNIENAVYDHPRVLDDFSARIVVFDRRTLFMPTALINESEGVEEEYYTALYKAEPADIMTDTDNDITAAFTLVAGLKGFISRTFPGARICSHLMTEVRGCRNVGEGHRMTVTSRKGEADFVLVNGSDLISASTYSWNAPADIVYHACNILDAYGVGIYDTAFAFEGDFPAEARHAIGRLQSREA